MLLATVLVQCAPAIAAQSPSSTVLSPRPSRAFVVDGTVDSIAVARDGTTYLGGSFGQVGPSTGPAAAVDIASGGVLTHLPEVSGGAQQVSAVASDGAGGWYVGGDFTHVGGFAIRNLAHILSNGTVDRSFSPNPSHATYPPAGVSALALSGGRLYVGGTFTRIGGTGRQNVAALDPRTGHATPWNPGAQGPVFAVAVSGSTVYIGGSFGGAGRVNGRGQADRPGIAALSARTGDATSWNPDAWDSQSYYAPYRVVYALAVLGSTVYVGGDFEQIGGETRANLAALDAQTARATGWTPDAYSPCGPATAYPTVSALAVSGSTVYVGGYFTQIAGQTRSYLAAVDAASGIATGWNPAPNGPVAALALSGSTLYVGGDFTQIAGQTRSHVAALDAATGQATDWTANTNGRDSFSSTGQCGGGTQVPDVGALAVSGSRLYVGGDFTTVGEQPRENLAALDPQGRLTGWNPGASGPVQALAIDGGRVYAGGSFNELGGQPRNQLGALSRTSGTATSWNPDVGPAASQDYHSTYVPFVDALQISGSKVYAGGNFATIGGQPRLNIAAINATSGTPTSWNPGAGGQPGATGPDAVPDGYVSTLLVHRRIVYVGGVFSSTGGKHREYLAAVRRSNGRATSWNPRPNNAVDALAIHGRTLYAGGAFTRIAHQPRAYLAALPLRGRRAETWSPGANGTVTALAIARRAVYAGGYFTFIGGRARDYLAALDPQTGKSTSWNPEPLPTYSSVNALALRKTSLLAGGSFTGFALAPEQGFARFPALR